MGAISGFVTSIVRAIMGLFKRQPDHSAETLFVNETASDVEVWQEGRRREPRTLHTTLRRGEVFAATTSSSERWSMVDARTGWTLRTLRRDTRAATGREPERLRLERILDPDGGVEVVDNDLLRNAQLSDPSGRDPWTGAISVTFRNTTPHDLELVRVVDYEEIEDRSCRSHHSVRIECRDVQAWQARTVGTNEPARGRVPAGVELGVYLIAGPTDLVIEIENTLIGFENRSLLDAQLVEIDARKHQRDVATLPPMEHLIVPNWRAREWLVRDAATLVVLDHVASTRSALSREITAHTPARPADGALLMEWRVNNSTVLRLDVEYLDHRGLWVTAGLSDLAPGHTGAARVPVNSTVRAREVWTGSVVAMRICTPIDEGGAVPEESSWEVAIRPGAGSDRSEIAASNETHLHVELVDAATGEVIAPLAPHESFPVGKPVDVHAAAKARGKVSHQPFTLRYGHPFFLRDRDTGAVIAIGTAQRLQPMMRARSPRLRSLRSGPSRTGRTITLTIDQALGWPVDVAEIDRVGRRQEHGTIAPAEAHAISVEPDRFVQILRHGTRQIVAELYTRAEDTTVALERPSSPAGPPTDLTFLNRSMLTLEVWQVGTAETGPPYPEKDPTGDGTNVLAPGSRRLLATHGGASFVVRDHHSKTLIDAVVAERIPRTVEVTTVHHGSDGGDPPVVLGIDISFAGDFPAGLEVDLHCAPEWTDLAAHGTGDPVGSRVGPLAAGDTPLNVGCLYRAVAPRLGGAVLAERIVIADDTTWEIRACPAPDRRRRRRTARSRRGRVLCGRELRRWRRGGRDLAR